MKAIVSIIALAALLGSTADAQEAERCAALVRLNGQIVRQDLPDYSVLDAAPPFTAPVVGGELQAIMCGRTAIHFALNDYHVLTDVRVPFYVSDGTRVVALEISNGQLRVRIANGQMSPDEAEALQQSVDQMQSALQGESQ
ncbi:MAG: hypothetical protein ABL932_00545 [Terricaulis sp.]